MSNVISLRPRTPLSPSVAVSDNLLEAAQRIAAAAHGLRYVGSPASCAHAIVTLAEAATLVQSVAQFVEGSILDGVE
ncbi:MAG TPA: hypothetical protein VEA41_19115 [Salinarimonas sp.]|nr:hypothetical protein [Salinarimonas sp.]